jgi:nicotinate-nucleotide adenylyltransferase
MPEKLGVFGGTFDPVHLGHLRVAEEALETLDLARVLFVPAADPPHKPGARVCAYDHRWRMIEAATLDHPRFEMCDVEHRLAGKSYTVITLRTLIEEAVGSVDLFFLLGLDSFFEVDSWWHYRDIFRLARLVILLRPGFDPEAVAGFLDRKVSPGYRWDSGSRSYRHRALLPVHLLSNTLLGISSTEIRRLVRCGKSIRYLVPESVKRYILENGLYADA